MLTWNKVNTTIVNFNYTTYIKDDCCGYREACKK